MVEVSKHPHSGNSNIIHGIIALGLFGTAFYFLFLKGNKAFEHSTQPNNSGSLALGETDSVGEYPAYYGRKEFRSADGIKKNSVYGFSLPKNINDLQFVDNHVSVIIKPNVNDTFGGIPQRALVRLFRNGNKLGYQGNVNGVNDTYFEDYDSLKDKVVLSKNIFIKNYKLPK